ncbi:MAG TPA: two-component regulator propeller domain-containing protein, partial [Verrucomicrobiae bacterium]|nr:two-component regulator propeller domain-containing protein [Verrucomicrobiae bacterium]
MARFDGIVFKTFDESDLTSSKIVKLFEDSRTNLWIGTETAGVIIVRPDGKIVPVDLGPANRGGKAVAICEDASGAIWLNTADGQLSRWRDGKVDMRLDN